ncbi:MAG: methylenetetrahydrofolate reductase C-terminal domain-containing protein [Deltaproteobacteria bacterium]|nr:methylenetetrahydrofolate reductase C-terminal domain-containing protein [Deltaproteobacteria bacterium]MBW2050630.1 methylenetetrahydrofolate reductase C-terminal domain-containing protein [Deltaproteobacteria bacterium]MBW2139476.1 methylenetetrahydrofolate reductase C-terminal domain-containing protein [Deltaproteobacteria bacterium]MBW2322225.1 methylenetetrahydrofolate reductase C-terminal domain-containing protein [Deltaproteobacteria bacterium]
MIVGERKPLDEILEMVKDAKKILIVGCKGCVTVCNAGGTKEVGILAATLRLARLKEDNPIEIDEMTLERQCDPEYIEILEERAANYDIILSMACSIGPQYISEKFPEAIVYPALNTCFMGGAQEHGVWAEFCQACGDCKIHLFGGYCPIARCSKSLLNGPCGGSADGKCEVDKEIDCVWHLIVNKLMKQGKLDQLTQVKPLKNWTTSRDGGPRKIVREDLKI